MRYLQLTHNEWDPVTKTSRPKVLHSFGREDQLDREAIKRLVGSLTRLLDPATALTGTTTAGPVGLAFTSSRPVGGTLMLDALWRRLGIDTVMTRLLAGRKRDPRTERVLFALVGNRALAPGSKLAAAGWVNRRAHIDGLAETSDDACNRAMDWLLESAPDLEREVFWQVATLLDHEVDLLFFDTTSTYFQTDEPDPPVARDTHGRPIPDPSRGTEAGGTDAAADEVGFRTYGKSKDSRDDLPQVVIGVAVTRAGIPVRVWCWPGNTTDSALIRQAREDMQDWTLARVMWVADRGFSSKENRRELRRGGGHYTIGEKLRSGSAEATAAPSRQGRYQHVRDNLQVKEVRIVEDERFDGSRRAPPGVQGDLQRGRLGRLMRWIRAKHAGKTGLSMKELRRRFCDQGWRFACNGACFTGASSVAVTRYRYRGRTIPTPWTIKPAAAVTGS